MKKLIYYIIVLLAVFVTGCEYPFHDSDSSESGSTTITGNISGADGTVALADAIQNVLVYMDDYADIQTVAVGQSFVFEHVSAGQHVIHFLYGDTEGYITVSVSTQTAINYVNIQVSSDGSVTYDSIVETKPDNTEGAADSSGQDNIFNQNAGTSEASFSSTIQYKKYDQTIWPLFGRPTEIDINDDGNSDVTILGYMLVTDGELGSIRGNFISVRDTTCITSPFSKGGVIDDHQQWVDIGYPLSLATQSVTTYPEYTTRSPWRGSWAHASNKYLPVQITKNGSVHYGWIRMTFPQDDETHVTIHDCAYETVAGKSIMAGSK